jgi:hypothetical protein
VDLGGRICLDFRPIPAESVTSFALTTEDEMGQQFLVQMLNRPDELGHLARALRARGVNIVSVTQTTVGDRTCAHLITDCCDEDTGVVLHSMGYTFAAGDGLLVELIDCSGALDEVCARLTANQITLEDHRLLYRGEGRATWMLAVDQAARARAVLETIIK